MRRCWGLECGETNILSYEVKKKGNPWNSLKPNKKHEISGKMHFGDPMSSGLCLRLVIAGRTT